MDDPAGKDNPKPVCCFHPSEAVVGVCAICLKERLLVLAARQGRHLSLAKEACQGSFSRAPSKKPSIAIPKVFAIGSSLLHRLDSRHVRDLAGDEPDVSDNSSTESLDDSFISIKFEDDGQVSWDKKRPMNPGASSSAATFSNSSPLPAVISGAQSLVEHTKRRQYVRWRKRFGHLLRLPRWKRTSKASVCNVSKAAAEASNGRRARTLARTRATELQSGETVRKEGA